jgi:glycosyltransferase involved in cell wall biosynthesis
VTGPFFTIAIPTKDRPDRVESAVRSVVDQTFVDLEVIVCDNSDEADARRTAAVVERFGDPRVRYVRTSGRLSMPDNWDHAIADARGEYVGILTDRSVFRRDAMEVVHAEIESTGAPLVNWFNDLYGRGANGNELRRRGCTGNRYRHSGEAILDYFVHGDPKFATKVVPKLMTSVCQRSVLETIRRSAVGRVCPPVAPDFTSGFLMLAHVEFALTIDDSLYVSCGTGNGAAFRQGGELAERFRRDLGMEWRDFVDHMPSDACFAHALVLNDLMRVRAALPNVLAHLEIDTAQYYLGCLLDYVKAARNGVRRDADLAMLLAALEREPSEVKKRVRGTSIYAAAATPGGVRERVADAIGSLAESRLPTFDSVFDAMAWDEAHPRDRIDASFLDLKPGVDEMKKARRRRRMRRKLRKALGRVPFANRLIARVNGLRSTSRATS